MGRHSQVVPFTQRVTVEAFPHRDEIPRSEWTKKFPVMVQVKSPKASSTAPVDFVAVLDISPGMTKDMLQNVKQAMLDVVNDLGPQDRFSMVVSLNNMEKRCTELAKMSRTGLDAAFSDEVKAALDGDGKSDIPAALQEAAEIINKARKLDEGIIERNSFIVLFSAGKDDDSIDREPIRCQFPVHTFGLGSHHDPRMMFHIAESTGGTYSFIVRDLEKMGSALRKFIHKEKSVVATNTKIPFCTHDGVKISSINSGIHKNDVVTDKQQLSAGVVEINRLYAGEEIKFMVFLQVQEGRKQKFTDKLLGSSTIMKLMTVGGGHVDKPVNVSVKRTTNGTPSAKVCELVDDELKRLRLVRRISDLAKEPTAHGFATMWKEFLDSGGHLLAIEWELEEDIREMQKGISSDANSYKMQGLQHMLSWLSSHNSQRATAKGSPYIPDSFLPTSILEQVGMLPDYDKTKMCRASLPQRLPCTISALVILLLAVLFGGLYTGIILKLWPALFQLMMESVSTVATVMNIRAIQQYLYSAVTYSTILGAFVYKQAVSLNQKPEKEKDEDTKIFRQNLLSERANIAAYPKACGGRAGTPRATVQISEMEVPAVVAT